MPEVTQFKAAVDTAASLTTASRNCRSERVSNVGYTCITTTDIILQEERSCTMGPTCSTKQIDSCVVYWWYIRMRFSYCCHPYIYKSVHTRMRMRSVGVILCSYCTVR